MLCSAKPLAPGRRRALLRHIVPQGRPHRVRGPHHARRVGKSHGGGEKADGAHADRGVAWECGGAGRDLGAGSARGRSRQTGRKTSLQAGAGVSEIADCGLSRAGPSAPRAHLAEQGSRAEGSSQADSRMIGTPPVADGHLSPFIARSRRGERTRHRHRRSGNGRRWLRQRRRFARDPVPAS